MIWISAKKKSLYVNTTGSTDNLALTYLFRRLHMYDRYDVITILVFILILAGFAIFL